MKKYLGIDIGGTTAKYADVSNDGEIGKAGSFATGKNISLGEFLTRIKQVCHRAVEEGVLGIGISTLGILDRFGGYVGGIENLPCLRGTNLKSLLQEAWPHTKVTVCNDAKAAALGELWVGEGKDAGSFICVTLGTGIGGSIVIDGKVIEGFRFRAGEIGYSNYQNAYDYFERHWSTQAMINKLRLMTGHANLDGHGLIRNVMEEDEIVSREFNIWMDHLAALIANHVLLLDPQKVIIGGGISDSEMLIGALTRSVKKNLPPEYRDGIDIVAAKTRNDAGILGAVAKCKDIERSESMTQREVSGSCHP